jgi:hypothetical protein
MNDTQLAQLNRKDLLEIARKEKIKSPAKYRKSDLIELIVKHQQASESYRRKKSKKIEVLKEIPTVRGARTVEELPSQAPPQHHPSPQPQVAAEPRESFTLPYSYNVTKIVLMVRDPYWAYVYWDIDEAKYKEVQYLMQAHGGRIKTILRVYDVTDVEFNGFNSHRTFDVDVNLEAKAWYIHTSVPDRDYLVDIGLLDDHGKFYLIARSNRMRTPRDTMSNVIDENWMMVDFDEIYSLSGGFGVGLSSGEVRRRRKLLFEQLISSGAVASSPGLFLKQPPPETDFFLEVGTELILYGRTKPDATVTVSGKPVALRPDGTFSVRFHLPDGALNLPVISVSVDKKHTRQITPIVRKNTL